MFASTIEVAFYICFLARTERRLGKLLNSLGMSPVYETKVHFHIAKCFHVALHKLCPS